MTTPREILLQRHQAVVPKLDVIRESAVATLCDRHTHSPAVADRRYHLREFFFSLRWHLAGMGAAWLLVILLNLNVGHSESLASAIPRGKIPPAQIILAALRENRQELLEMIQPSESREVRPPKLFPRSERHNETLIA